MHPNRSELLWPAMILSAALCLSLTPNLVQAAVAQKNWNAAQGKQVVLTLDGETLAGTLVDQGGDRVTLVTPSGEVVEVRKKDVQKLVVGPRSSSESLDVLFDIKVRPKPAPPPPEAPLPPPPQPVREEKNSPPPGPAAGEATGSEDKGEGGSSNPLITGDWQPSEGDQSADGQPQVETTDNNGIKIEARGTLEEGERRRQAWIERGGAIGTYGLDIGMSIMSGKGFSGYGGTLGCSIGLLLLRAPNPELKRNSLLAARIGVAGRFDLMSTEAGGKTNTNTQEQLSLNLGGQVGFGSFGQTGEWSGIVLGVDWLLNETIIQSGSKTYKNFNYKAFNFTIDFTDLASAMEQIAQEAHWRVTIFLLPPLKDMPFMMSIAIGMVDY